MYSPMYNHKRNNLVRHNATTSVKFRNNEKEIVLEKPRSALTPGNCSGYDRSLVYSKDCWHQLVITKNTCSKIEIERALIDAVNHEFFIPIAYKMGVNQDTFYIFNQGRALEELLKENLTIKVGTDKMISITMNLGIARHEEGQIEAGAKIEEAIESRLKKMVNYQLDLSNFKQCDEFFDIKLWIGIGEIFSFVCTKLIEAFSKEYFRVAKQQISQINLTNNNLKTLKPLLLLKEFVRVETVHLTENRIEDALELQYLKIFKLKHLTLKGNSLEADREELDRILTSNFPELIHCDIPRVLRPPPQLPENQAKRLKLDGNENIPINEGGNIVTADDIDIAFKKNFQNLKAIESSWSKVFIEHKGRFKKQEILDTIFEQLFNQTTCYPCYYQTGDKEDSFFLYKNFEAIKILVKNQLKMKIGNEKINLRLHLRCADYQEGQIKFYKLIPEVIKMRGIGQKLDIKDLQTCLKLKNLIVNVSSLKGFRNLMDWMCAIDWKEKIIEIDLSGNGIKHLEPLDHLIYFPNLTVLNLSNNQIDSIIGFPKDLKIVVLSLDRNPLSAKYYHQPYRYVAHFTQLCKNLQYLDGHKIDANLKIATLKNFHCTSKAFNAVENFVEYFFKNFDGERYILDRIYTPKSMYTERLNGSVMAQAYGKSNILAHLMRLPRTEHDLINTTIDVPLFTDRQIQMVINGILRMGQNFYTYTRHFMLIKSGNRAIGTLSNTFIFHISNEILHINDIKDPQIKNRAFRRKPASLEEFVKVYDGRFTKEEEVEAKIGLLQQITKLKRDKCKRFLEDANGSINDAIEYFSNFYTKNILKQSDFEELPPT